MSRGTDEVGAQNGAGEASGGSADSGGESRSTAVGGAAASADVIGARRVDLGTVAYSVAAVGGALLFYFSARGKLAEIISSDAIFFAGVSLSLFVWGVTKAYNHQQGLRRTREELDVVIRSSNDQMVLRAIEERVAGRIDQMVVDAASSSETVLGGALLRWHERLLRQHDVLRHLAVLRRNLEAAYDRSGEFFDAQAEREDFHTDADQFGIIVDDLSKAAGSALRVDAALRDRRGIDSTIEQGYVSMKLNQLGEIARDLTEALERRNQVFSLLFDRRETNEDSDDARAFFRVMTSDLRKAQRTLLELLDRDRHNVRVDEMVYHDNLSASEAGARIIRQQYRTVFSYARVAKMRANQVREALEAAGLSIPPALDILAYDVSGAADLLEKNWPVLMEEIGYDREGRYRPVQARTVQNNGEVHQRNVPALPGSSDGPEI